MQKIVNNIKIFSSFWFLLSLYFVIPIFVESVSPPVWFYSFDANIPFISLMIIPYYFYYIIIIVPPLIWKDELRMRNITSILNIITIFCYLIFIIWPLDATYVLNQVNLHDDSNINFLHRFITYDYLYQNAFPSMHVAVASFLCASYYYDFKSFGFFSLSIMLLIFLATFLIKQHYFIDSITGLFLGLLGFYYYTFNIKQYD